MSYSVSDYHKGVGLEVCMDGVWLAGIALTALSSGHGSLDNNMVMSPGPDQSAIREACSDFEHNAERSGWGRLQPVGALPSGKIERLVILRIDGALHARSSNGAPYILSKVGRRI